MQKRLPWQRVQLNVQLFVTFCAIGSGGEAVATLENTASLGNVAYY